MELMVIREPSMNDATPGSLYIDDQFQCYTLEDIVREVEGVEVGEWKVKGKTAIPRGRYPVTLESSRRFNMVVPKLHDVPGFEHIEIHPGNTQEDTEGCILVGTQRQEDRVDNSRIAFTALMVKLQIAEGPIFITIA